MDPTCWDGSIGAVLLPSTGHMWNCGNMVRPSDGSREKQEKPWAVINVEKIFRPTTCSPSFPYQHHSESSSFINKCLKKFFPPSSAWKVTQQVLSEGSTYSLEVETVSLHFPTARGRLGGTRINQADSAQSRTHQEGKQTIPSGVQGPPWSSPSCFSCWLHSHVGCLLFCSPLHVGAACGSSLPH